MKKTCPVPSNMWRVLGCCLRIAVDSPTWVYCTWSDFTTVLDMKQFYSHAIIFHNLALDLILMMEHSNLFYTWWETNLILARVFKTWQANIVQSILFYFEFTCVPQHLLLSTTTLDLGYLSVSKVFLWWYAQLRVTFRNDTAYTFGWQMCPLIAKVFGT